MATISKRETKSGVRWVAQIRLKGMKPVSRTFSRQTDAKAWAAEKEREMSARRGLPVDESHEHTLSEAIQKYEDGAMQELS